VGKSRGKLDIIERIMMITVSECTSVGMVIKWVERGIVEYLRRVDVGRIRS